MNIEKAIILLVLGAFVVTSISSLSALGGPIAKEQAIEISKSSALVKQGLAVAHSFEVDATYYNSSMVDRLREGHNKEMYAKVPVGHSVWNVVWSIYKGVGGYVIIVLVDAETGTILHDETGIVLL